MRGYSHVLEAALTGRFAEALDVFAGLISPTPEDERWAAYSELSLGLVLPARDRLLRLLAHGHAVARVELATVYRLQGDAARAFDLLAALELDSLGPFDRTLAHREQGACLLELGRYAQAEVALEEAWTTAQHDAALPLRPGVAYALGYAQSLMGHDRQARHHLDIAVREAVGVKRLYPLLARAYANVCLLWVGDAERDLQEAEALLPAVPIAAAVVRYTQAALLGAQGRWEEAGVQYEQAATQARELGDRGTQVFAALGAAASFTAAGRYERGAAALGQAQLLASTVREQGHCAWREGSLRARQGGPGLPLLEEASSTFEQLGLWREVGSVLLHQAEAQLHAGEVGPAASVIGRAMQVRQALGNGAALLSELRALPRVQTYLHKAAFPQRELVDDLHERTAGRLTVELMTLGDARVRLNGEVVTFQLRRVVEVLAYLLRTPHVTFQQLSAALFAEDARSARGYFHQVRTDIVKRVPGVRVAYDRVNRTYAVETHGATLVWDAGEVWEHLQGGCDGFVRAMQMYRGRFLPDAESEWARAEREALELALLRAGLTALARWRVEGNDEARLLWSRRLLELDPLDLEVVDAVLEATREVQGHGATQLELTRIRARFMRDLGEVPAILERWAQLLPPQA